MTSPRKKSAKVRKPRDLEMHAGFLTLQLRPHCVEIQIQGYVGFQTADVVGHRLIQMAEYLRERGKK